MYDPCSCSACVWFVRAEDYEMTDDDVEYIQRCLVEDGVLGPEDV